MDHIRKLSEDTSSSKLTPKEVLEDAYSEMKKDFDKVLSLDLLPYCCGAVVAHSFCYYPRFKAAARHV